MHDINGPETGEPFQAGAAIFNAKTDAAINAQREPPSPVCTSEQRQAPPEHHQTEEHAPEQLDEGAAIHKVYVSQILSIYLVLPTAPGTPSCFLESIAFSSA